MMLVYVPIMPKRGLRLLQAMLCCWLTFVGSTSVAAGGTVQALETVYLYASPIT